MSQLLSKTTVIGYLPALYGRQNGAQIRFLAKRIIEVVRDAHNAKLRRDFIMITAAELVQMPIEDRLALVEIIWTSIVDDASPLPIPASHIEELERRIAEFDNAREVGSSWEEVHQRIQS